MKTCSGFKLLIALTIIVLIVVVFQPHAMALEMIGIITAKTLKMQSLPRSDAPTIVMLKRGAEVNILAVQNDWLNVAYDRQAGYIFNGNQAVHIIDLNSDTEAPEPELSPRVPDKSLEALQSEAEIISRKIDKSKSEVKKHTQKEVSVLIGLNQIDLKIDRQRRKIRVKRKELEALENKIKNSRTAFKQLAQQIETNEAYVADRLAALYKLNQTGSVQFLVSSGTFYDMIFRIKNLEAILTHDQKVREQLLADRQALKDVLEALSRQQISKHAAEKKLNQELEGLARTKARRSRMLAQVRAKRSLEQAALESLQAAAVVLDDTIAAFNAQKTAQTPSSGSFKALKGLLKMPVAGKIISLFGAYTNRTFNITNFRNGIDIQALKGAEIQSVYDGVVLYADWFKGYGKMIIIDHGDSYYTVYAHLDDMYKKKGDSVETGEPIASVGESGSMVGPALYFEIRHHGKPLDPMNWIQQG
jgi:septal ring factor EnvC (AmiA/AmiB activator)